MLQSLTPIITLSAKKSASVATADDFAMAKAARKTKQSTLMIPVRLTLNSHGQFVRITRSDKDITPQTVGHAPVYRGQNTTIDALMTPVLKDTHNMRGGIANDDHVSFLVLPFVTPEEGLDGYVHADFRLRSTYLPCREKQPAQAYQSMMPGEAWIDIQTQTIVRLDVIDPMQTKAPIGTLLHNIPATDSAPHMIVVTCYLANGGCCFERVLR